MSYNIPNLNNIEIKTTLICLSSGQIEKIYLEEIVKNKNGIYYHNNNNKYDKELNQLIKQYGEKNSISKVINDIC